MYVIQFVYLVSPSLQSMKHHRTAMCKLHELNGAMFIHIYVYVYGRVDVSVQCYYK